VVTAIAFSPLHLGLAQKVVPKTLPAAPFRIDAGFPFVSIPITNHLAPCFSERHGAMAVSG